MAKWEYQTILSHESDLFNFLERTLNQYGEKGWEMCSMSPYVNNRGVTVYILIFKRKIKD